MVDEFDEMFDPRKFIHEFGWPKTREDHEFIDEFFKQRFGYGKMSYCFTASNPEGRENGIRLYFKTEMDRDCFVLCCSDRFSPLHPEAVIES
jgi:hypothetical protein